MYVRRHVGDMCILIAGSIGERYLCILMFGVFLKKTVKVYNL